MCDIIPMDVYPVLLGRPWQYDKNVMYNGRDNTFTFEKDGRKHTIIHMKDEQTEVQSSSKILLVKEKEFLKHIQYEEVSFVIVGKPWVVLTNKRLDDFLIEVHKILEEYVDIVFDDLPNALPPIRSISHYIDLILWEMFSSKVACKMTPTTN